MKTNLKETGSQGGDWIHLAQDMSRSVLYSIFFVGGTLM
jgi:hypothetical protein